MNNSEWTHALLPLLSLASRLESEGQYNLAKLARAAVDALGRRAAYQSSFTTEGEGLVEEIEKVTDALSGLTLSEELLAAFRHGANALAEGRIPTISETPHPYVCRTCGQIDLGAVTEKCPTCGAWPDTFQWFAPIYWLDALDPPAALEKLRQTPLDVAALLDGLSEQAVTQEPPDGEWAIRNVITHMRDAQGVLDYRLELFRKMSTPSWRRRQFGAGRRMKKNIRPPTVKFSQSTRQLAAKSSPGWRTFPWRIGGARATMRSLARFRSSSR